MNERKYEIEIQHHGIANCGYCRSYDKAKSIAEEAVYDIGAEYSAVRDCNGEILIEYEL